MHHIWGRNILAPITPKPARILDIGTGTGAWVVEVADRYPTAYVWGVDLSPIQPTLVPPNAEFMVLDLHTDLDEFAPCSFDLVHSRYPSSFSMLWALRTVCFCSVALIMVECLHTV
jgi:trans-aconitate methyltransferase